MQQRTIDYLANTDTFGTSSVHMFWKAIKVDKITNEADWEHFKERYDAFMLNESIETDSDILAIFWAINYLPLDTLESTEFPTKQEAEDYINNFIENFIKQQTTFKYMPEYKTYSQLRELF